MPRLTASMTRANVSRVDVIVAAEYCAVFALPIHTKKRIDVGRYTKVPVIRSAQGSRTYISISLVTVASRESAAIRSTGETVLKHA